MAYNLIPCDRDQPFLMPPSLKDWLPERHLARFMCEVVEQLELSAFYRRRREDGWGRAAYHPKMMVALLLYSYAIGCRSSRAIERRCVEDIAYRYICANECPDHATIARFRAEHQSLISQLFTQALRLCVEAGLVRVGLVALDGMRVKANASMSANKTKAAIEEEVEKILEEAAAIDAAEDRQHEGSPGDDLPKELASTRSRLARLRLAKERLEREERDREAVYQQKQRDRETKETELGRHLRGRKPKPKKPERPPQANVSDPDSRILKSAHSFVQGYNAQALVSEDQIVLAADLTNQTNDVGHLHPMLDQATANLEHAGLDAEVEVLVADAGYYSDENVSDRNKEGPELLIATNKGWKHRKDAERNPPRGRIPKDLTTRKRME